MHITVKPIPVAAFLASIFFVTPAVAGDEVCVVNETATAVTAGSAGSNEQAIANDAFCISVDLSNDGPTQDGGMAVWVRGPGDTYVEVNIEDPFVGDLDFTSNGQAFGGADIGGGLHMSGAQKGGDGVYRLIIQEN